MTDKQKGYDQTRNPLTGRPPSPLEKAGKQKKTASSWKKMRTQKSMKTPKRLTGILNLHLTLVLFARKPPKNLV